MGLIKKIIKGFKLKKQKMTILVIGLNNSGKSTILNSFKAMSEQGGGIVAVPTVGFNVEQFKSQGVLLTVIDMSGTGVYRNLWEHHFKTCQGIVYVIDSSDKMRLVVVRDELDVIFKHPDLDNRPIPILFYSNKIDSEDSLSDVKLAAALGLKTLSTKPWYMCASNAISGEGLEEGVKWLIHHVRLSVGKSKKDKKGY